MDIKAVLLGCSAALFSVAAPCQTASFMPILPPAKTSFAGAHLPRFQVKALRMDSLTEDGDASDAAQTLVQHHGIVGRIVKRGLQDQKELYASPFKRSNIKWDVLFLAGTGSFLATDRQIESKRPSNAPVR
jgi:hypothetical protein